MSAERYTEWRICGTHSRRGDWQGTWRQNDPRVGRAAYDLKTYVEGNDEVWIERREVEMSAVTRIEVER